MNEFCISKKLQDILSWRRENTGEKTQKVALCSAIIKIRNKPQVIKKIAT